MIGSLALLCIGIGALLWIVGAKGYALRLLAVGIALAVIGTLLEDVITNLSAFAEEHEVLFAVLAGGALLVTAFARFTKRKQSLDQWFDTKPVSVKRRMEREP